MTEINNTIQQIDNLESVEASSDNQGVSKICPETCEDGVECVRKHSWYDCANRENEELREALRREEILEGLAEPEPKWKAMSREEILAMEPGLKMNLLIATKIFGWIPWEEKLNDYSYISFQKPGDREPYKRQQNWEKIKDRYSIIDINQIDLMKHIIGGNLKNYSTDIKAAWEIIEELGCCYEVFSVMHYPTVTAVIWKTEKYIAYGKNVPEAISKAALIAFCGERIEWDE